MKKPVGMIVAVLTLAVGAQAAIMEGDVIAIDFGATAPAEANWNQISSSSLSISDLERLSDGNLTGVGVTVTLTAANGDFINNIAPGDASLGSTDASIYNDHLAANDLSVPDLITVTYTGLDDSLSYTLTGGMARGGNASAFEQTYTVGGIDYHYTDSSGVDAYAEYAGLSSSGGVLTFTVSDYADDDLASISQMTLTAMEPPGSPSLVLAPTSISLELVAPDAAVDGIITASYIEGASSSSNIEILTYTADAGFSAAIADTTLGLSNTEEDITVTFDNSGIGLANGESTNSTLVVTWSEVGDSTVNTSRIPLDVTYINEPNSIELTPTSLSLTLNDPDTSTNGTVVASFIEGTVPADIEIVSVVATNGFSVAPDSFTLGVGNTNETVVITYSNTGALVNNGDTADSSVIVTWTETGSGVTNTTDAGAVDVVYYKPDFSLTVINVNIGENSNGYETIAAEVWNNTAIGTNSAIQDIYGQSVTGVSVSVVLDATGTGSTQSSGPGSGYVPDLESMCTSLVFANNGEGKTTVTIFGLGADTEWDLDIYAGLDLPDRANLISINGEDAVIHDGQTVYNTHAPISYSSVFADENGNLTVELVGHPDPTVKVSYIQGLTLTAKEVVVDDVAIDVVDGNVVLSWESGGTFNVETNANLMFPDWGVLESDATSPAIYAPGGEAQLFYRLSK